MQLRWRYVAYWPKKQRMSCLILLFLIVLLLMGYGYAWPYYQKRQQTQLEVDGIPQLQKQIDIKAQALKTLAQQKSVWHHGQIWQRLNQSWQPINVLTYLRQLSDRVSVKLITVHGQQQTVKKTVYFRVALLIRSNYSGWVTWLSTLAKSQFLWRISELHMQPLKPIKGETAN